MAVRRGKGGRLGSSGPQGFSSSRMKTSGYGWLPDRPDQRDLTYAVPLRVAVTLPPSTDLRDQCPLVYDQRPIGSCTANAIATATATATAIQFDMMKQGMDAFAPSRLFIYYNERAMENTVPVDAGGLIRDGIKSVASQGSCPETQWPYLPTAADRLTNLFPADSPPATQPPETCYADAARHKAISYPAITQNTADMKGCLAEGFPFIVGFSVYESFESQAVAQTGNVTLPQSGEAVVGGRCVLVVGYDDEDGLFICRNSWGSNWGDAGYFYMPYAYLLDDNPARDFWTVRVVH
jgi:C1A family cysteine protease